VQVDYAKKHNIGGIMIWALNEDDDDATMLEAVAGDLTSKCPKNTGNAPEK